MEFVAGVTLLLRDWDTSLTRSNAAKGGPLHDWAHVLTVSVIKKFLFGPAGPPPPVLVI